MGATSFLKNTLMTLSRQFSAIILGLISTVIIARTLGPVGNGMYNLVVLLPTMLLTLLNLGVGTATVYYVGQKRYTTQTIVKTNTLSGLMISAFAFLCGLIFLSVFYHASSFHQIPIGYLYLVLAFVPLLILNEFYVVIFQGIHDFRAYNSLALVKQISALIALVLLLLLFKEKLAGAVAAFIIGIAFQFAISWALLFKGNHVNLRRVPFSRPYFKESLVFGLKAHFSNMLSFVNYRADILVISYFTTNIEVGIYSAAVMIAERLWIVSQSISSVLFPRVSSLKEEGDKNALTSLIARNVFAFSILVAIVIFFLSKLAVFILYGKAYLESAVVLQILLPGITLFSVDRILSNDLAGRGKPELNMYTSIFTVISNLSLSIGLVPVLGLAGAAIATSSTYCLSTVIKLVIFKRVTGVPVTDLLIIKGKDLVFYKQLVSQLFRTKIQNGSRH